MGRIGTVALTAGLLLLSMVPAGAWVPIQGRSLRHPPAATTADPNSLHAGPAPRAARRMASRRARPTAREMLRPPTRDHGARRSDGTPLLRIVPVLGGTAVAVDERTARVFVMCSSCGHGLADRVSMLDARSGAVLRTVRVGGSPQAIAVDTTAGHVFVANQGGRSVSMLDARSGAVLLTAPIAGDPTTLAVAEHAGRVFVTDANANNLSVLDARTGAVLRSFNLHGGPFTMAVAERAGRVFVGTLMGSSVSMLDARSGMVLRTVRVGIAPNALAVDEQSGRVFVTSGEILDARTGAVLHTTQPDGLLLAVDPPTRRFFATGDTNVDVLAIQSGAIVHSTTVDTAVASVPIVIDRAGRVAELLESPVDSRTNATTGPGRLLVLDGYTAAVRRRITVGTVLSFGLYDMVAADLRTNRVFALSDEGVFMFDTTRL